MGADCCILQTAWSRVDVNGHLNGRNQMDLKELTEHKHPTAKAEGKLQGRMESDWIKLISKWMGFKLDMQIWKMKNLKSI